MVKQSVPLDEVFAALSNGVRRQTIETLSSGARSASELAAPHAMTLAGFMKHLRVLSDAGLVSCAKDGRVVTCRLVDAALSPAARWFAEREKLLEARMDALGRHLYHREQVQADRRAAAKPKGIPR